MENLTIKISIIMNLTKKINKTISIYVIHVQNLLIMLYWASIYIDINHSILKNYLFEIYSIRILKIKQFSS